MDLSIVIPCYNEAANVPKMKRELLPVISTMVSRQEVGKIPLEQAELIFVDDGSHDGTYAALQDVFADYSGSRIDVHIEQHAVNRGLGAALRTGFSRAQGGIIVTTDSDGTYQFSTIPDLLSYLTPDVDMVTASPYHPLGGVANVPGYRLILSRGSSLIYRRLVNPSVYTYTALFRAYRREFIQQVPFESDGFLAGTELLVNGMLMGYRVAEFPTILQSRVHGVSKAKIMRTIGAHLCYQGRTVRYRVGLTDMQRRTA